MNIRFKIILYAYYVIKHALCVKIMQQIVVDVLTHFIFKIINANNAFILVLLAKMKHFAINVYLLKYFIKTLVMIFVQMATK